MSDTSFNNKRRLCPDGSCVGVIGADGRCGVCGKSGDERPDLAVAADNFADDDEPIDAVSATGSESGGDQGGKQGGFDPGRRLCDDGSCVGVIGPDGRCGVCGLKAG